MKEEKVIMDGLVDSTARALSETEQEAFYQLQTAAKDFLKKVQLSDADINHVISRSQISSFTKSMYQNMRQDSNYTRTILTHQHHFETALNNFLNRHIYLTYVTEDGSLKYFDDIAIGEIYQRATGNKGRGNIGKGIVDDTEQRMVEKELQYQLKRSEQKRKAVYLEAIRRYENNATEGYMNYNISRKTFYWWKTYHKILGGFTDPIVNKGPIAEGYVDAVVNEDPDVTKDDIETSLSVLWKTHIRKDSVGAVLKGDIILDSNNNIQFAVKMGSFSTARVGQYINLAYNVLQLKPLTTQELQQFLPSLIKVNKKSAELIVNINEMVAKAVQQEFDKK